MSTIDVLRRCGDNPAMLYVFKSRASANLVMLEPHGRRLLQIIGKEPAPRGIVLPADMAAAVAALQEAIRRDEQEPGEEAVPQGEEEVAPAERVSLRQRMTPMIDMLRRCEAAGREIVWGV
jgi:hypothetical protein